MSESPSTVVADSKDEGGNNMTRIITGGEPLTALDRCDRCGGQAYVKAFLKSGLDLLFCAHHAREHMPALKEQSDSIVDQRSRLETQESAPRDAGSTI